MTYLKAIAQILSILAIFNFSSSGLSLDLKKLGKLNNYKGKHTIKMCNCKVSVNDKLHKYTKNSNFHSQGATYTKYPCSDNIAIRCSSLKTVFSGLNNNNLPSLVDQSNWKDIAYILDRLNLLEDLNVVNQKHLIDSCNMDKYSLKELAKAHVSADTLLTFSRLNKCEFQEIFSSTQLIDAGFSKQDLSKIFSAKELKEAGYSFDDLRFYFSVQDLIDAGFSISNFDYSDELKALYALGYTAKQLKDAGHKAINLKIAGIPMKEIALCAYTSHELAKAYISIEDLIGEGVELEILKNIGYSSKQLKYAGFSAWQLKDAGFSAWQLLRAGYERCIILSLGFSAQELKDGGFYPEEISLAGFSSSEIKNLMRDKLNDTQHHKR